MKIVCTGISGLDKPAYAERVKAQLEQQAHKLHVYDSWTYIKQSATDLGQSITKEKILDSYNVDELRAIAFERICHDLEKNVNDDTDHSLVLTHACFRWNKYLRTGFDVHYLKKINPDMYVNIVDEVVETCKRLSEDTQWKGRLDMKEVAMWRDEETFLTEVLAQFDKKRFYLIAAEEFLNTICDLLTKPASRKIYLSYPITAILKEKPALLDEARAFAADLRKKYIVFNPLAIKDLMGDEEDDTGVLKTLRDNTVWRDFKLINQSDMVVVYYPVEKNSPGANQEISHGFTHNKEVYLYYPFRLSPFWDEGTAVTRRFEKFEDLRSFLLS